MSKPHQFQFSGFHGSFIASVMIPNEALAGGYAPISDRTAARLRRQACGISGCKCGESPAFEEADGTFLLPVRPLITGRYS